MNIQSVIAVLPSLSIGESNDDAITLKRLKKQLKDLEYTKRMGVLQW